MKISKNTSYFLRGIAMLMVIFSHYFEWGAQFVGSESVAEFVSKLGDPGVGLFFFLSGYALYLGYGSEDKKTDKTYLWKRFKNMYFPYLLIATVIAVLSNNIEEPKDVIRLLAGADYWFIIIILIIYISFYFVGKLPKYRVFIMTVFIIDMSLWLYLNEFADFWYTANWCFALGLIWAKMFGNKECFTLNIKDYVFSFIGRISLYIYVLHTYIYFQIINIESLMKLNWYVQLGIAIGVTIIFAFAVKMAVGALFSLFEKRSKTES